MTLVTIAGWIVAGWLLIVGLMFVGQRTLLYHPDTTPPDAGGLLASGLRPLPVRTEDGLDLTAWHRPAAAGRPTLVLFQGNAGHLGDRLSLGAPLAAQGFGLVLAPYRGYGGGAGTPTEEGLYRDGRATVAALESQAIARRQVALWGESLGGGIATRLAAEAAADGRPFRAVILQAPFTSVADRAAELYPFVPVRWLVLDRFDNLERIGVLGAPLLIVHGESDSVVPASHGRRLLEAAGSPKSGIFIPRAGHNDLPGFGLADRIAAFLEAPG
ncbi:MAG: alpha/beta hydrolase [Alphaproteobacteria bacterium]|nr:alpha/beta hydrolase [Alphaproteobacteria bacterium]